MGMSAYQVAGLRVTSLEDLYRFLKNTGIDTRLSAEHISPVSAMTFGAQRWKSLAIASADT